MKIVTAILFTTLAAAAGCTNETPGADEAASITCAPREGACAVDPRLPEVRGVLGTVGIDLDRDVAALTLVSVPTADDAINAFDQGGGQTPTSTMKPIKGVACDADATHGICCYNDANYDIQCFTW